MICNIWQERQRVRKTVERIAELAAQDEGQQFRVLEGTSGKVTQLDCHAEVVDAFSEKCFALGKVCCGLDMILFYDLKNHRLTLVYWILEWRCIT